MKISTETGSFRLYSEDNRKILRLLKDSGFTAYDFSMFKGELKDRLIDSEDYALRAKELREYADGIGLDCNQTHAPFPTAVKGDDAYNEWIFPQIVRAIEVSGILGAKICVVHPCNDYTAEENAALYRRFEPYARKARVKIGLENMWNWDRQAGHASPAACSSHGDFLAHLSLLDKDVFVACLDIGHAEMKGLQTSAVEMIETLKDNLQALHIHDNDRLNDNHELPYSRAVEFAPILEALKKIGYRGDVTLESSSFMVRYPLELYPPAARFMAEVAASLKNRLESD